MWELYKFFWLWFWLGVSFRDFNTVTCQSINASRELTTLKIFHRNCSSRKESNSARKVYNNQSIFLKKQEHMLYQLNSWSIFWINFLTHAIMHGLWYNNFINLFISKISIVNFLNCFGVITLHFFLQINL